MLPKENRLTKKKDFDAAFKKGESIKNGFLVFKAVKNHLPESRFGFVVSKKVSNKATVRNLVKRRLRAAVDRVLKDTMKGRDVIIITLPGSEKNGFSQLEEAVNAGFKKLKLYV